MEKSPPAPRAVPPRIQSAPVGANPDDISAIFSNLSFSNFLRDPLDEEGGVPPLPSDNVPQQPPPPTHQRSVPPGLAGAGVASELEQQRLDAHVAAVGWSAD